MKFEHMHSLGKDEARRRIEKLGTYWASQYGVSVNWNGDSARLTGSVKGVSFDATLTLRDSEVSAEGTDPGMLMRAVTTAYLKRKLAFYLDPKKTLEQLVED